MNFSRKITYTIPLAALFTLAFLPGVSRAATSVSLRVFPQQIPQGGTAVIMVTPVDGAISSVQGKVGTKQVIFFSHNGEYVGFYSAPVKAVSAWYPVSVTADGSLIKTALSIKDANFPVTVLHAVPELEQKGFTPSATVSNLKDDTQKLLTAHSRLVPSPLFSGPFRYPLSEIEVTGPFGAYYRRGDVTLEHLGVDMRAATGTPVYAVQDGRVLLAEGLSNYGNTLMLDHGARIVSLYLHLNGFAVTPGAAVKKGDIIGYSGDTGYAIGPHLHLSMWVNGTSVDPLQFIALTQKTL